MAYTSEATRAHFTCPFFGKVMSNGKFVVNFWLKRTVDGTDFDLGKRSVCGLVDPHDDEDDVFFLTCEYWGGEWLMNHSPPALFSLCVCV